MIIILKINNNIMIIIVTMIITSGQILSEGHEKLASLLSEIVEYPDTTSKDQLLINKMLLKHCKSKHQNMSMAWIDCRKAFDSVPYLELIKVSPIIVNFLKSNMPNWKIILFIT